MGVVDEMVFDIVFVDEMGYIGWLVIVVGVRCVDEVFDVMFES